MSARPSPVHVLVAPKRWRSAWLAACLLLCACAPHHALQAPPGFARYGEDDGNRWVTPDGVVLRAREIEEPPEATLAFWSEALSRHLERSGYRVEPARAFRTVGGLEASRVDAIGHRGAEDWLLVTALYVQGPRLWLVEATGPWRQLHPVSDSLQQALTTFTPEGTGRK